MTSRTRALLLSALLALSVLTGCVRTRYIYVNGPTSENERFKLRAEDLQPAADNTPALLGAWSGQGDWEDDDLDSEAHWLNLTLSEHTGSSFGRMIRLSEVTGLPAPAADTFPASIQFKIQRPAGALTFTGQRQKRKASGQVRFDPDDAYSKQITSLTGQTPTLSQSLVLTLDNIQLQYIQDLRQAGLSPTLDDILKLARSGVRADYTKEMKQAIPTATIADIINLARSGINTRFAFGLREAGYDLPADQVIKLARSGISSNYAKSIRNAGYGKDPDELISLARSGMSSNYLQSFRSAGYSYSADDMVKVARSGVSSTFAKSAREAGFEFSADDLIKLARSGVSSKYLIDLHNAGINDLSADEIIELSRQNIRPELIKKLRKR